MRAIAFAAASLFVASLAAGTSAREGKDAPAFKVSTEHLDKSWNLAVKSVRVKEVKKESLGDQKFTPPKAFTEVHITLEFADEPGSVKEIRRRFVTEANMPKVGEAALKEPQTQLWFLDGEGVELKKLEPWSIEGEITGVVKDAFRVVVFVDPELIKKTKKIDFRPASK